MATQKYNKLAGKHVLVIGGSSGNEYHHTRSPIEISNEVQVLDTPSQKPQSNPALQLQSPPLQAAESSPPSPL
jgi:hypothetical protein